MLKRRRTIPYQFGPKHIDYIRACRDHAYNTAEGAVRSGKTIDNVYAFANELKTTRDRIHLASGSTVANAKLNIGDANGFGLEWIFRGQCRWSKYKDNDALIIRGPDTNHKTRIVLFAGGGKADSFKKIRGNSYGMWIATEINIHHESFIQEALNRQVAAKDPKVFWDLNPDHPKASIYEKYIDRWREDPDFPGGFQWMHFTLDDNITLSEERKNAIKHRYDPGSVWYMRDIEGKRVAAEGAIYKQFLAGIDKPDNPYKIEAKKIPKRFMLLYVGVDFGGRESKHAFVATGITYDFRQVIVLRSRRFEPSTPTRLEEQFVEFCQQVEEDFGDITEAKVDSAEQVLKSGLEHAAIKAGLLFPIKNARKRPIVDRIKLTNSLVAQGRFFYTDDAETVEEALKDAIYDEKKIEDVRLDDGSSDIDTLDAYEYTIEQHANVFMHVR